MMGTKISWHHLPPDLVLVSMMMGVLFGHDTNYMLVEGRGKDYFGFEEEVGLDAEVTNASPSRTVVVDESG